jgi:hypothetical protein
MPKTIEKKIDSAFDPATTTAEGDAALAALVKAGDRAEALIDAWVAAANAGAVAVAAERAQGPARKAARRALNVLKSRGVTPPAVVRVAAVGGKKEEETFEGWMLAPDGNGVSLLVVAARTPTSRYRAILAFISRTGGVLDVRRLEAGEAQLKDAMQSALRGNSYRPIKVPVDWARARIEQARSLHREKGVPEPFGFAGSESLLGEAPEEAPQHPFDAEGLELADDDAKELVAKSAALHRLPEFRGWLPSRQAVDEMLANVGNALPPGEEPPDPKAVEAAIQAELLAATDRYFTPERRADLVLSMKDSALSVLARDGETVALDVAAAIKGIERCGLITDPPHEVPFLKVFFEKALAVLLQQGRGELRVPRRAAAAPA